MVLFSSRSTVETLFTRRVRAWIFGAKVGCGTCDRTRCASAGLASAMWPNPVERSLVPVVATPVHATPEASLAAGFIGDQGRRLPLTGSADGGRAAGRGRGAPEANDRFAVKKSPLGAIALYGTANAPQMPGHL